MGTFIAIVATVLWAAAIGVAVIRACVRRRWSAALPVPLFVAVAAPGAMLLPGGDDAEVAPGAWFGLIGALLALVTIVSTLFRENRDAARLAAEMAERDASEKALRESEERFRIYYDLGLIGMAITSLEKGWVQVNERLCGMFGYAREEIVTKTWSELTHPEDLEADVTQFNRVLAGEIDGYVMDKRFIRKDGTVIHSSISVKGLRRPDGSVDHFVALVQDITDRKLAEERQKRMMAELDHRVKNTLAAVIALTERTITQASSFDEFTETYLGRIRSLARTHEALAEQKWSGIDLAKAVELTVPEDGRVKAIGPPVGLPPESAAPFCMAIHEIATNAMKYGALSVPEGHVTITWELTDGTEVTLHWRETGGPPLTGLPEPGFGTRMIKGLVMHEMRGSVEIEYLAEGIGVTLVIPLKPAPRLTSVEFIDL